MKITKSFQEVIKKCNMLEKSDLRDEIIKDLNVIMDAFDIKFTCAVCGKEIKKPKTDQVVCSDPECKEEYYRFKQEEWKAIQCEMKKQKSF